MTTRFITPPMAVSPAWTARFIIGLPAAGGKNADVLGTINHPIGPIDQDTVIKAITIGPGKLDSPMVTFKYQVENGGSDTTTIRLTVGQKEASINDQPCSWRQPPCQTPGRAHFGALRFISEVGADIAWDPTSRHINISLADRNISLAFDSTESASTECRLLSTVRRSCIRRGALFVPLRFISEMLGAQDML